MAALRRKGRKKSSRRRSIFCFFGGCFGISNKVSSDRGDGKLVEDGNEGKTAPVNDQALIRSSREIHVVREVMDDKTDDMIPKKNGETSTIEPAAQLSHSVSLPLLPYKKEKMAPADKKGKKGKKDKELIAAGQFDSIYGGLIILVTLTVMLIWGKACAILCTAAWLYFVPRVRANFEDDYALKVRNGENQVDLDSKEYKKKVVLQGLLDRNQHYL